MLSLLLLTGLSLLCVVMNVAQIVAGFRSLPIYQTAVEEFGITSLSSFGAIGVFIEGKFSFTISETAEGPKILWGGIWIFLKMIFFEALCYYFQLKKDMFWGSCAKLKIQLIPYSLFLSKPPDSEHLALQGPKSSLSPSSTVLLLFLD